MPGAKTMPAATRSFLLGNSFSTMSKFLTSNIAGLDTCNYTHWTNYTVNAFALSFLPTENE